MIVINDRKFLVVNRLEFTSVSVYFIKTVNRLQLCFMSSNYCRI